MTDLRCIGDQRAQGEDRQQPSSDHGCILRAWLCSTLALAGEWVEYQSNWRYAIRAEEGSISVRTSDVAWARRSS